MDNIPDGKVHGANMGPIWGWQDPGGPHVGPMNLAMWNSSDRIFKWIFFNENYCILVKVSLNDVPKGPVDNNSVCCQVVNQSLPKQMMT